MRFLLGLCLALMLAPAAFAQGSPVTGETSTGRPLTEREGEPDIIGVESNDERMNAAIAEARAKLPYFWTRKGAPGQRESSFVLKVAFPAEQDGDGVSREHIWIDDVRREGDGFSGILANEPNWMRGKRLGDKVTFTEDMISDWGFERGGKLIGYYTVRVMLPDMAPEEAAAFRLMLGDNPR